MFAFQLVGRVASNTNNNFDDWAYNQAQYWSAVGQNLAGGGTLDPNGGSKEGCQRKDGKDSVQRSCPENYCRNLQSGI